MSRQDQKCDQERIDAFLSGQLPKNNQVALEEHLEECDQCLEKLQQSSAEKDIWQKASAYLRPDPHDSVSWTTEVGLHRNVNHPVQQILDWLGPTDDPRMLGRVNSYEVLAVIGNGGMGVVLKALDPGLNRIVAIKVLAPHLAASATARIRFSREAQAAAAITHDNVIDIYSVSQFNGLPFLVMPYARGPSLQLRLDQHGPLPIVEILRIGYQIASGLAAAHEQGLVHRDVKPSNILFVDDVDRLLITDFGLARTVDDASVTQPGVIAGTPQYMSPEQARGDAVDGRSDLFALGSVIYALATAWVPFSAETNFGLLRKITDDDPRPITELNPEIPDWLGKIVNNLHAKDCHRRFQTADEVAEVLKSCLAYVQNPATESAPSIKLSRNNHRSFAIRNVLAGFAGLLVIGILAFAMFTFAKRSDSIAEDGVLEFNSNSILDSTTPSIEAHATDLDFVTRKRLKAIVFAIHSYADAHDNQLPPPFIANPEIKPSDRLSGLVLLLPYFGIKPSYLDQAIWEKVRIDPDEAKSLDELFATIDLTVGWNDKANAQAASTTVELFQMPGILPRMTSGGLPVSHVAFVQGYGAQLNGVFPGDETIELYNPLKTIPQISDGTHNTLAIGQVSQELGPWIAAGNSTARFIRHPNDIGNSPNFGGVDSDAAFFVFCDGSVKFIDLFGSRPTGLKALATRSGNDVSTIQNQIKFYDSAAQFRLHTRSDR